VWTSPVLSNSGYKYYVVFLDDFSHYIWTFPIRAKFFPSFVPFTPIFRLSSGFLSLPCKLTMAENMTLQLCVPSSPPTAYPYASHARTRCSKTAMQSVSYARLVIVCAHR
jgi:hypothetical protein